MSRENIHVVPSGNGWAVKREGVGTPVSKHRTQTAATNAGRNVARHCSGELVIHRANGQIRDKDSFRNDPHPPVDRKH